MAVPPKRWHTREDSGIVLDRELRWWHDGEPVEHPRIIEAFNQGLVPREDGKFELRLGNDWCLVEVEDAAYAVRSVRWGPADEPLLALSDRTEEPLDIDSLRLTEEGVLVCQVKGRRAKARFSRDAQYTLGQHLEQTAEGWCLCLREQRYPLPGLSAAAPHRG
jgi:hypothetical protein